MALGVSLTVDRFVDIEVSDSMNKNHVYCNPKVWPTPNEFLPEQEITFKEQENFYIGCYHIV